MNTSFVGRKWSARRAQNERNNLCHTPPVRRACCLGHRDGILLGHATANASPRQLNLFVSSATPWLNP
eukprot:351739-Chlamydomonas_euryale.AAC.2